MRLLVAFALATMGAVGMIVFVFVPFYLDFDVWGWMACVVMTVLCSALMGYGCSEWEREMRRGE